MSETASFTVAYDGASLRSHTMDVRDLAPAMLSLGNLFDEVNRVINGKESTIKVHVKAQTAGSFHIAFEISQSFGSQITGFLTGSAITSAANLLALISGTVGGTHGLIWLIRRLQGQKPGKITDIGNGMLLLEHNGETFDAPVNLLRLYKDIAVRNAIAQTIKPLEQRGIDTFAIIRNDVVLEKVNSESAPYFAPPVLEDERLYVTETEDAYSIVSLAFKDDNKWRLYDGSAIISVIIRDEDFMRRVNENMVYFAKGDILRCRVRTTSWQTQAGLRKEHEVLEVLEHRQAARQLSLGGI